MKRPPVGSCWRILTNGPGGLDLRSVNYQALEQFRDEGIYENAAVFDELVILFAPDPAQGGPPFTQQNATCLHLEQMDTRDWFLGIGDLQFNIHVGKDGALGVMLYGGDKTKFTDGRA